MSFFGQGVGDFFTPSKTLRDNPRIFLTIIKKTVIGIGIFEKSQVTCSAGRKVSRHDTGT
jgi:hypothetical protein